MEQTLLFPALATMIALLVYFSQAIFVTLARRKYDIKAPATTGNPDFERVFRVHYNTLEQLPLLVIPLWFFALLISPFYAGCLGIVWSVGRIGYMYGYYQTVEKRHSLIAGLADAATITLIIGSLWGIVRGLLY